MKHTNRLISLDGRDAFVCETNSHPQAVIFCNRVFVFHQTIATVNHFREINAERVREIQHESASAFPQTNPERIISNNGKK